MPALSLLKKERMGLGGSRMGTKNKITEAGRPCSWEGYEKKKLKHTVIQKYCLLEILIHVKAGRVK
jgi:hypothetical protein